MLPSLLTGVFPMRRIHGDPPLTARTADRHDLYQRSVQNVARECRFLARAFERTAGRKPTTLREDFCGTALLCAEWVKTTGRTAVGVDHDPDVLAWGAEHNRAAAVRRLEQDVRAPCPGLFDLIVALNFSFFALRTRRELLAYFTGVRRSLGRKGVFVTDAYGGWASWRPLIERRRLRGFTYVWEQARIDPVDHTIVNHIGFEFPDGSRLARAFSYHWRLWTLPEIRELLAEAGFRRSWVYWEDRDANGDRTRTFRRRVHVAQEAAWVAYVVAER
jgi:SAM-dependent methyltransferase